MAFVLIFSIAGSVSAQVISEDDLKDMEKPSYGERFTANIFISIADWFIDVLGAQDVSYLVFQDHLSRDDKWLSDGFVETSDLDYGIFPKKYFSGILMLYEGFEKVLPIPIVVLISLMGLLLLFSNFTGDDRSKIKDYLLGALYVVVALRFGIEIWNIMFKINEFLIGVVYETATNNGVSIGRFLDSIWGDQSSYEKIIEFQSLGLAILVFLAFCMTFILNYQYALRMITLSILFLIFPLVLLGLMFPSRRHAFALWVHETASQIFMQFAHAVAIVLFFYLTQNADNISFWVIFAYFFGLPVVVSLVQRVVGAFTGIQSSGGVVSNMGSMMGFAAMANMGRIFSGIKGKAHHHDSGSNHSSNGGTFNPKTDNNLVAPNESMMNNKGNKIPVSNGFRSSTNGGGFNNKPSISKKIFPQLVKGSAMFAGSMAGGAATAMATGQFVPGAAVGGAVTGKVGNKVKSALMDRKNIESDTESFSSSSEALNGHPYERMQLAEGESPTAIIGESKAPIGEGVNVQSKAPSINEIQKNLNEVQVQRQQLEQPIQSAKTRLEKSHSQYGEGSAYQKQLKDNLFSLKQQYHAENGTLKKINQVEQPAAYQKQSVVVGQLKSQMESHQEILNTPHPEIKSAQQNLTNLTSQARNYDKAIQNYKEQLSSAYSSPSNSNTQPVGDSGKGNQTVHQKNDVMTNTMPTARSTTKQEKVDTPVQTEESIIHQRERKIEGSVNKQYLEKLRSKRNSNGRL